MNKIAYLALGILAILALAAFASPAQAYDEGIVRAYNPPPSNYNPNAYNYYNYNPNPPAPVPPLYNPYQAYQPTQNPTVVYRTVYVPAASNTATAAPASSATGNPAASSNNTAQNGENKEVAVEDKYGSLAASALFGRNTFTPSGLVQWILFAILMVVIVILVRKVFSASRTYHETPLKHA